LPGDFIRVTTINAGTGLEGPIVIVAGIHELFEKEGSLRLSEDERAELVRENTRKLYMAFTRAGQRLILTYVGDLPAPLKELARRGLIVVE
jgi:superfamily I DNA/RNA helicase